ncbi:MAG: PKD domain-containing protein [Pleomorphochaeta sp.]
MKKHLISLLILPFILLLISCPMGDVSDINDIDDDTEIIDIPLLETPFEILDFVNEFDDDLNNYLYEYALRYNRVNTLVNSALFSDPYITSKAKIVELNEAAIKEIDDFIDFCKEMEIWNETVFQPAITEAEKNITAKTFVTAKIGGMSDSAYARRLVEMYLDPTYKTTFSLQDISRKTGVDMARLRFLCSQVSSEFNAEVDGVDVEQYTKQIEFYETVRDTSGKINATLALATPLGAFGAATTTATTTAAAATGFISKVKTAKTVIENSSAVITFAGNVLNLAVDEEDIPPTVKTVTQYNSYVSLVLGGVGGFTGSNRAEKALAIIGTSSDGYTTYIDIRDDGIKKSNKKLRETTPDDVNPDNLDGILLNGDYNIPKDIISWEYADFDWTEQGLQYWEDLYDGVEDIAGQKYKDLEQSFNQFVDDWNDLHQANETEKESVDKDSTLPKLFDKEDLEDEYEDHSEIEDVPDSSDFNAEIYYSIKAGFVPVDITFYAKPNTSFIFNGLKFTWDFGDGTTVEQNVNSNDYTSSITHQYTQEGNYTVKLLVEDYMGNKAESSIEIITSLTDLQKIIDVYKDDIATIDVPDGYYTGGQGNPNSIYLWNDLTLTGSPNSIIAATIYMYPNTRIEGFQLNGGSYSSDYTVICTMPYPDIVEDLDTYNIEIIDNKFTDGAIDYASIKLPYGYFIGYPVIYSGQISKNEKTGGRIFIQADDLKDFEISENIINNTTPPEKTIIIDEFIDSKLNYNEFTNASGIEIDLIDNSEIKGNTFDDYTYYASLYVEDDITSGSIISDNIIQGSEKKVWMNIKNLSEGAFFRDNVIQNNIADCNILIQNADGEVSGNIIQNNREKVSISISRVGDTGKFINNQILDNGTLAAGNRDDASVEIYHSYGQVSNNIINGNSLLGLILWHYSGDFKNNTVIKNKEGGVYYYPLYGNGIHPYIIKDDNPGISNNSTTDPTYIYYDLYTPWEDDRLPADD